MEQRLKRCYEKIKEFAPVAIILSPENRFYLTGMKSSAGMVVLTEKENFFFTDFRYIEAARKKIKHMTVMMLDRESYPQLAKRAIKDQLKAGVTLCGFEDQFMTVEIYHQFEDELGLELIGISRIIAKMRSVKEPCEIAAIRQAQSITDLTFTYILNYIKAGKTEQEIALEMDYFMRKNGAERPAFSTIVISGVKTSMPHGVPDGKTVKDGDFVTMDFGAMVDGYCSDMTRTVAVGYATDFMMQIYSTVLKAQELGFAAIKAGVHGCDVDQAARDFIYHAGFDGCFGHGLGHSLGLEIHEEPRFSPVCNKKIENNMIITVEPGIYIEEKLGVRIEDMALIMDNGCEDLTDSPKNLFIL